MPNGFGTDGDTAYYESLARKVRADEAAKQAAEEIAARERRISIGLPADEHWRKSLKERIPFGWGVKNGTKEKKSAGEILASIAWGNRSSMGAPRDEEWKKERDAKGNRIL